MDNKYELLKKIINNFEIEFDGSIISKESLMRGYHEFLSSKISTKGHDVGVVLHTGSICFDIISIVFSAVCNIILCDNNPEDVINSIDKDDIVLYNNKRYKFSGIVDDNNGAALLCQPNNYNLKEYVPKKLWHKIEPYNGFSKSLDGRGIRSSTNDKSTIIARLFELKETDVPSICNKSSIIVMPKGNAESILNKLFIISNDFRVNILDFVTASYFSENEEYQYSGNPGKLEPNLKITSKISVARDLILDRTGNKTTGLFVFGYDNIERNKTELLELMNRRSLIYVFITCNMDLVNTNQIIQEYKETRVLACTKELLLAYPNKIINNNRYTNELNHQINIIIGKKVKSKIIDSESYWDKIEDIKKSLLFIKNSNFYGDEKDNFIRNAFSLIKLFLTVPFPICVLEDLIANNKLEIHSPKLRIKELFILSKQFPDIIRLKSDYVVEQLNIIYSFMLNDTTKYEYLNYLIEDCREGHISIIVHKEYYIKVLENMGINSSIHNKVRLSITTPNKFDNSLIYNKIFVMGIIEGKRFNPFRSNSSNRVFVIMYDFEQVKFNNMMQRAGNLYNFYNVKSGLLENDICNEISQNINNDFAEIDDVDSELELYISSINQLSASNFIKKISQYNAGTLADIIAVGSFTEGGRVLFTKSYKAYVFNMEKENVKELDVEKLSVGDTMIFIKNNNVTKDIVDYILNKLASSKSFSIENKQAYFYSKLWKDVLKNYKDEKGLTYEELAIKFSKIGLTKHVVTIRSWLDDDLHIVGPMDVESYEAIGDLTNNKLIKSDPVRIKESCDVIRKIRVSILKKIGQSIINKLSGRLLPDDDSILQIVYENVNDLAVMLQLESLTYVDAQVPINMTNRPLDL